MTTGRPMPLYLTEFAYAAYGKKAVPEATRAKYLTKAFDTAQRNDLVTAAVCDAAA